jgi:DNA-binding GntR family transcriptional regulator
MSDSRRIEVKSVVDQVYIAVRERILTGELARGSRLRQEELAAELGVSRTPLREALRRLASEGLVDFNPNRGATVSRDDVANLWHAWAARVAIEPGAARLAAQAADPDAVAGLRALIGEQRAGVDRGGDTYAANRDFHLALVAASGNPHLVRFAETLWVPRIARRIYSLQAVHPRRVLAWADDHDRIVDAIAAGDDDLAGALTRAHIAASPPPSGDPGEAALSGELDRELEGDDGAGPGGGADVDAAPGQV